MGSEVLEASLRGKFKGGKLGKVVVGDRVRLARHDDGSVTVEEILPRRSLLRRRVPGRQRGVRLIAANVDQVLVVASAADPVWSPGLVDRFLVVASANELPAVLVVNKVDLLQAGEKIPGSVYRSIGYEVLETSAKTGVGLEDLRSTLTGKESLLMGSTGVGKSSLLNALEPGFDLRTQEVGGRSRSGRHTTVSAVMLPFGESAFVVDTPGLRDVGLWGVEPAEVAHGFPEILEASRDCRFDNCRHDSEPDCEVRRLVLEGGIAKSRVDSLHRMMAEAEAAGRHWE